jgi:hypothetical protein
MFCGIVSTKYLDELVSNYVKNEYGKGKSAKQRRDDLHVHVWRKCNDNSNEYACIYCPDTKIIDIS